MNLQSAFYTLGIIIFSLMLIFMVVSGVFLFLLIRKVNELQKTITEIVDHATEHPGEVIVEAGSALVSKAFEKLGSSKRK